VRDAGELLIHLHVLSARIAQRAMQKAERLARTYDSLEERITKLL
jgi:hypothetical protein